MLSSEERQVQDKKSHLYEEIRYRTPWSRRYHARLFAKLADRARPAGRVLDVGCGPGLLSDFMPDRWRQEIDEIIGVDYSTEMARYASKRLNGVAVADAQRLPFGDQTFDVVFARAVLHHLPDPNLGAAEIARVLRPGGGCVFFDTHENVLSRIPRKLMLGGKHFSEEHKNFSHSEYLEFLRHRQ